MPIHTLTLRITTTGNDGVPDALSELVYRDGATQKVVQSGRTDADGYVKLVLGDDTPTHAHLRQTRLGDGSKFVGPETIGLRAVPSSHAELRFEELKIRVLVHDAPPLPPLPASATPTRHLEGPCPSTP